MVAITNLQYGWTLFVEPLREAFGWQAAAIQVAFTFFVLSETWLVPVEGYLVDRFGPCLSVGLGGILVGLAWILNSWAETLTTLYIGAVVGGIGAGVVYGASIGNALKWFPHRRGLAAGITAAAFGAGSAVTVLPINHLINTEGYRVAFFWFGLGQGLVVVVCALLMRAPVQASGSGKVEGSTGRNSGVPSLVPGNPPPGVHRQDSDFHWYEVARSPVFWLMYLMFTMVTTGGLMAVAQLGPMASDYGVAKTPVTLLGITAAALPFALALDRILNGLARPFFGWVSDHLGRENTMFLAFGLEGAAIVLLLRFAHIPMLFVILTGLTFFAWGEIFSLFPALCADLFGRRYVTTNYGLLYTAKGTASLLVPLGSWLQASYGSWTPVLVVAVAFDWITALLAILVLKPLARRHREARAMPPLPPLEVGAHFAVQEVRQDTVTRRKPEIKTEGADFRE
jgi:OFA family oxalate/formate antiporter-like MFS transporter